MNLQLKFYRPRRFPNPQIAVFAPRPFGGNQYNTDGRLQFLADEIKAVVITVSAPGTGRAYISRTERQLLRPDAFAETAARFAQKLAPTLSSFAIRLGIGDSGRGILIAHMQLAGLMHKEHFFTHILLRDCTNLVANPREPTWCGARRVHVHNSRAGLHTISEQAQAALSTFRAGQPRPGIQALLYGPAEIWALGRLMCGDSSRKAMESLAAQPTVPLRYVDLDEGISGGGNPTRSYLFCDRLQEIRQQAIDNLPLRLRPADYYFSVEHGRHRDLTNPDLLVTHAQQALILRTTSA